MKFARRALIAGLASSICRASDRLSERLQSASMRSRRPDYQSLRLDRLQFGAAEL
ncbi:hypothetical protein BURMUCF1_A1043 [Burkholderia multivorans ATCC BAA-247]|nr:hypothetical protein BURMUCF1_A1043 [Burkholderia multivorans ATCC BAA-247]